MECGLERPHPHAGVLWGGVSREGIPENSCCMCSDFSEDPAALSVSKNWGRGGGTGSLQVGMRSWN